MIKIQGNRNLSLGILSCALMFTAAACGPMGSATSGGANSSPSSKAHQITASVTVPIEAGSSGKGAKAFGNNPLVVQPGTVVTWVNNDSSVHTATSNTGAWDSGMLASGKTYSHTFDRPGTYAYHCAVTGAQSMSGVIHVANPTDDPSDPSDTDPTITPGNPMNPISGNPGSGMNPMPGDDPSSSWTPPQTQAQQKPYPKPYPTKPYPKPYPTKKPYPQPRPTLGSGNGGGSGWNGGGGGMGDSDNPYPTH
jgi:plastocyanin